MAGRVLCSDEEAVRRGYRGPANARRRQVLRETIAALEPADALSRYHRLAGQNLDRWRAQSAPSGSKLTIEVRPGDWGEVTLSLTQTYGECFAVLNMANAELPGGGYVEGAVAQEENIFRRSDCHFRVGDAELDRELDRYRPEVTRLLSGEDGVVYLDAEHSRVCVRGPEAKDRTDLGYPWLADDTVFPFFELRSAAQDLRGGSEFDSHDARRRIAAQLNTLRQHGIRHVVLGAFGCGAFLNPAKHVARLYRQELAARAGDFSVVAFAIFAAGYGPDNFKPFAAVFGRE